MTVEVLVVGLGPAGASAARAAAEAGASVLGIDARAQFGAPVQCAELIPLPLRGVAGDAAVQRVTALETVLPSGCVERIDMPGVMIDRGAFDRRLAAQAAAAGARLVAATRLTGLDIGSGVATLRGGVAGSVRFRTLVAADGPRSTVAALMGLAPLRTLRSRQYRVPLLRPSSVARVWLGPDYPGGYAWLFPRGESANLGFAADRGRLADMKTPLERLHASLAAEGTVGAAVLARTGGPVPVGGMRAPAVGEKVLFAGDAAGLAHPVSGAGIAAAVASGGLAGAAAAEALYAGPEPLREYQEELTARYGDSLSLARHHRRLHWDAAGDTGDRGWSRHWIASPEYRRPVL